MKDDKGIRQGKKVVSLPLDRVVANLYFGVTLELYYESERKCERDGFKMVSEASVFENDRFW